MPKDDKLYRERLYESIMDQVLGAAQGSPQEYSDVDSSDYAEDYWTRTGRQEAIQGALNTLRWGPEEGNRGEYEAATEAVRSLTEPDVNFRTAALGMAQQNLENKRGIDVARKQVDQEARQGVLDGILQQIGIGSKEEMLGKQLDVTQQEGRLSRGHEAAIADRQLSSAEKIAAGREAAESGRLDKTLGFEERMAQREAAQAERFGFGSNPNVGNVSGGGVPPPRVVLDKDVLDEYLKGVDDYITSPK